MDEDPGYLALLDGQLHQAHRNAVSAELAARGLREVGHPMLLTILRNSEGAPREAACGAQRELADMLNVSPASVSASLKNLERGGYIERQPDPADARHRHVLLTDKGRAAVDECLDVFRTVAVRMTAGFTREELEQLISMRRRMLANLQKGDDTH